MTSLVLSLCVSCRRNNGDGTCTSFPDGIPDDIFIKMADHRTSRDGELPYLPDPAHSDLRYAWEVVTGNETVPLTASALTDTFYPGQPRDRRGRWTKGMGAAKVSGGSLYQMGHLGDNTPIIGMGAGRTDRVRSALNYAGGKTTRIHLDAVDMLSKPELNAGYSGEVIGRTSYKDNKYRVISVGEITFSKRATDLHKESVIGVENGSNYDVPTGRIMDGLKVTITHEVGHAAHFSLTREQEDEMFDGLAQAINLPVPSKNSATRGWWMVDHRRDLARAVSLYGVQSEEELVAEAWTEYILSNEPRPAARAVGGYIEGALA